MSKIIYIGPVVGISFLGAKENFETVMGLFSSPRSFSLNVELRHDKDNAFDKNAVAVYAWADNWEKLRIGYLPAKNGEN